MEWDGEGRSWGEPVTLTATVTDGVDGDRIEWISRDDHYRDDPVVLGVGPVLTTQALRPGTTTVEARLLNGSGDVVASATADVSVSYRQSWRVLEEGMVGFPDGTTADVWVADGHAFVARRSAGGISIVDLSSLNEVGRYTAPTLDTGDVKVANGIAYLTHEPDRDAQHPHSVTFLDVSTPRGPVVLGGVPVEEVPRAHNVFVEGTVLAIAPQSGGGGINLYDVSDPAAPERIDRFSALQGRPHDVYLRDGRVYGSIMPSSIGNGGLVIADVSGGAATIVAEITYPKSFTHSAWLSADGTVLYIADERVNAPIRIYDVSNPGDPRPLGTYQPRLGTIPHNWLVKDDRFAYLAHYKHGLEVLDVSDPANPELIGFYDTHPGAANDDLLFGAAPATGLRTAHEQSVFEGAWGVHWDETGRIVVSDVNRGLFVFRFTGP